MRLGCLLVLLVGCGGSSSGANPDGNGNYPDAPTDPAQRYEPWTVGARWSYKLTDPTNAIAPATGKLTTIMPMQDAGNGKMAYLVHIEKLVGSKDVWEVPVGDLDVRYKTVFYDQNNVMTETDTDMPYRLKLDESLAHTMTGAHYSETFTETITKVGTGTSTKTQSENWSVVSDHEQITVIAGTFTALHLQRNNPASTTPSTMDYWYARGVGKLKETGGAQNEELESYTPGP